MFKKGDYMFAKPKHGWTNLQFEDFSERASYLTDIPNDCLDAFIYALRNKVPAVIYFDAEGWDFHLVSSWYHSYVIVDKDETAVYVIDKTIFELAKELIFDIENNFDDWLNWDMEEDYAEKNKKRFRKKIKQLQFEINKTGK